MGEQCLSSLTLAYIYSDKLSYQSIAVDVVEDLLTTRKTCCTTVLHDKNRLSIALVIISAISGVFRILSRGTTTRGSGPSRGRSPQEADGFLLIYT
jgi:hypothetical protein